MRRALLTFLVISFLVVTAYGQKWHPVLSIPVTESGQTIPQAWTGGINNPQFSRIDLNQDHLMDLMVFDRKGNQVLTYINNGSTTGIAYEYAPQYKRLFPEMESWAMARDFNLDGVPDLIASNNTSAFVYKGSYTEDGLSFERTNLSLFYDGTSNVYIASIDIPSIVDMDGDGDLDILSFPVAATVVEHYENLSMDVFGTASMDTFKIVPGCWGSFSESASNRTIDLDIVCKGGSKTSGGGGLHSGSTLLLTDHEKDGDLDLILGDAGSPYISFLEYGSTEDKIISADTLFPSYDSTLYAPDYPAAFEVDVNNNGQLDLVFASNDAQFGNTFGTTHTYIRRAVMDGYRFEPGTFIEGLTMEFGERTVPCFIDIDGDGNDDLIVGTNGYFLDGVEQPASLIYLRSTGDGYEIMDRNFANSSQWALKEYAPAAGDLDNDGVDELLIGTRNGLIHVVSKVGNDYTLTTQTYANIDVGSSAAPYLFDIDDDEDLDLIIGNNTGKVVLHLNHGDKDNAQFSDTASNDDFGQLNSNNNFYWRFAQPWVEVQPEGNYLQVGRYNGRMHRYPINNDSLLSGAFELTDTNFGDIDAGLYAAPALRDINGDGALDMIIGNSRAGLEMYSELNIDGLAVSNFTAEDIEIRAYPNPTNKNIILQWNALGVRSVEVSDVHGRVILSKPIVNGTQQYHMNLEEWSTGAYFVRISTDSSFHYSKFIKH